MPPLTVLIKPSSSACNMQCAYCFYRDVSENRQTAYTGALSLGDMEKIIAEAFAYAEGACAFVFQGGEPTLRGLSFYEQVVALQRKHNTKGLLIQNSLQTNGICMDKQWAAFLHDNHFLVGLSLDGTAAHHNRNRLLMDGQGSWNSVMRTVRLFQRFEVEYNVLCVLTGQNARAIEQIYSFFKKENMRWLQFIPCLEPFQQERGKEKYHLSCEEYGAFLIRIFDLWYADLQKGEYISIRHLDNWLAILLGRVPEACAMAGRCSIQFVVEGDCAVYPCDFYVLDEWKLGVVGEDSFAEMYRSPRARQFVEQSQFVPNECKSCRYGVLCRNGCRRDRLPRVTGEPGKNYYCASYLQFFTAREREIAKAAQIIRKLCLADK